MEKKQNSIDWLVEQLECQGFLNDLDILQAKAMHKEEIEEAYDAVIIDQNGGLLDGKEYYKQTFGGNNE